ncbi:MAG: fibronectin type III domain-containing protein [Flavobacteriales bacterium]|jgi:hypothetical protein|nr:fibronectin type III domain-containing protein [Flavobacteriales bacterium]
MLKYLQKAKDKLTGLKAGISTNSAAWAGQPDTPASVQTEIDTLDTMGAEIELLKNQLKQKLAAARILATAKTDAAKIIEKRAVAIHATNANKLVEYNIRISGVAGTARELPTKAIIKRVKHDADGIGFKLSIKGQGTAVDFWEIERGMMELTTENRAATVLQVPYPFLASSKKLTYVDDDVLAGVRYFYRVRGVNAKGGGAWSEPVSAVQ